MAPPIESQVADVVDPVVFPNLLQRVFEFNRIGQITPPSLHFNADRVGFYTGMQCEELAEKIRAIAKGCLTQGERNSMLLFAETLHQWGLSFKGGSQHGPVLRADREELLDGDIDMLVVSIGSLIYSTPHFKEAVAEVLDSNDAKFINGIAQHDANGKIVKPEGWKKPNLQPFVDQPID